MKKAFYTTILALTILITFHSASAQCNCTAVELTGLNLNKDSECSSDIYSGYQNHVSIEILRNNLKTGTFQWSYLPENSTGNWIAIPAGWTGTENIDHPFFSTADNGSYRCIFTETATNCRDTSIVVITIAPQPNIYITDDSTTCEGIWFSVHDNNNVSGAGNTNCWQFDGTNCQSNNSSFLFTTAGCTMGNSTVSIIVSNYAGCFDESHVSAICNQDLLDVFIDLSGSDVLCKGDKSSLLQVKRYAAISLPGTWQFQWHRNGKVIYGATSPDYTPTLPGTYSCNVVSGSGCQKTTNPIVISFLPTVSAQITANSSEICNGDSILLQVAPGNGIQFEWYRNGISTGVTNPEYYAKKQGNYKVLVTSLEGCTKFSNVIHPVVFTATIHAIGNQELCTGDSVLLEASTTGNGSMLQWYRYNKPIIGATSQQFTATRQGRYWVVAVSAINCTDTSNSINLTCNSRLSAHIPDELFIIHPNPASTYLDLTFSENTGNTVANILIINILGQTMLNTTVNVSASGMERITLPQGTVSGTYLLILNSNNKSYTRKFMVTEQGMRD